jgi:microsomal triglyceride transfer protein large subunit
LSSFISSDEEPEEAEEIATAGMEVTALGVQVRPFVFFSGQGELMGHVWSGTGSEKTPAFQVRKGSVRKLDCSYETKSLVTYLKLM